MNHWLGLLFIIGFIILHFSERYLNLSAKNPRSKLLSFAGGATVTYVFIYLLPELAHYNDVIKEHISSGNWLTFFEDYTYTLALVGLLVYYGLDLLVTPTKGKKDAEPEKGLFILHLTSFIFYNLIIGYIFAIEDFQNIWAKTLYFVALGFHFIATDHTLKEIHEEDYDKFGRWFLVTAILLGWLTGILFNLSEIFAAVGISLLAGGLLLNTFKEEIDEGKSNNFWMLTTGGLMIAFFHVLIH